MPEFLDNNMTAIFDKLAQMAIQARGTKKLDNYLARETRDDVNAEWLCDLGLVEASSPLPSTSKMHLCMSWLSYFLLACLVSSSGNSAYYSCVDLTPNLCELNVEKGQVLIRGIHVTYWKYSAAEPASTTDASLAWPIVTAHGGPSFTHHYMLPLQQQACVDYRPIYFYDQAGCGDSALPTGANVTADYPWLLDPNYYATQELPALLEHWQLTDFHLLGNSWGTLLAQLYALNVSSSHNNYNNNDKSTTAKLRSLVLSGPLADSQTYIQDQWDPVDGSLGTLPPFLQSRIHAPEQSAAYESSEYKVLDNILTGYFTLRTQPAPDCWLAANAGANLEIYTAMQGPSEFSMQGVLASINLTSRLPQIKVPVLLTHGKYDTMRPTMVQAMQDPLPFSERLFLSRSGHVSMIDEPGIMNEAVSNFYGRVEAAWQQDNVESVFGKSKHTAVDTDIDSQTNIMEQHESDQHLVVVLPIFIFGIVAALWMGYAVGSRQARQQLRASYEHLAHHMP